MPVSVVSFELCACPGSRDLARHPEEVEVEAEGMTQVKKELGKGKAVPKEDPSRLKGLES